MADPREALRVLVLARFDAGNASVIRDFLLSFNAWSRHAYYYVFDCTTLDGEDLSAFDVILVFWTVHLLGPDLPPAMRERIRRADAVKVLFLQDEYRDVRPTNGVMAELGVNVMFTCVAPADHDVFYPQALVPSLEATYTVLPGYVPGYLESLGRERAKARPVDVGYRSRAVPYYLGDLGRSKRLIAEVFTTVGPEHGFRTDVSVCEHERLYGHRWVRFLRSCRFVLGSPSGASVVDFTGEIRRRCELYLKASPHATYAEAKRRFFAEADWKVVIDTVSPRVFEAAAFRCTLVQVEGAYGGLLEPDVHYIAVRRDFSNLDEVLARMKDRQWCESLAARAHHDLVASGAHGYRAFAERFDQLMARHARPGRGPGRSRFTFYAGRYLRHGQAIVPRKDGCVTLPSGALAWRIAARAVVTLAGHGGRVTSRLAEDPRGICRSARAAVDALLRRRTARRLVLDVLRDRRLRATVQLHELLEDLLKLDLLGRALSGTLPSRVPFRLRASLDDGGVLILTSVATDDRRPIDPRDAAGEDAMALDVALGRGTIRRVVWDHSALGLEVMYRTASRWTRVGIGAGGVHGFAALAAVMAGRPGGACAAVLAECLGTDGLRVTQREIAGTQWLDDAGIRDAPSGSSGHVGERRL